VREPNQIARLLQFGQHFTDSFSLVRQNELWPNIGQRLKDKLSQVHPRVRQLQALILDITIAAVEKVDIDRSRNIFCVIAPTP
jgi:hypothetical protein